MSINNMAGPTATVLLHKEFNQKTITDWALISLAPGSPFYACFDGAQRGCTKCYNSSHSQNDCNPSGTSQTLKSLAATHAVKWGSIVCEENITQEEPMKIGFHAQTEFSGALSPNQSSGDQAIQYNSKIEAQFNFYSSSESAPTNTDCHSPNFNATQVLDGTYALINSDAQKKSFA
ncbi:hypothetical protein DSO57_1038164 [Entomophthora muscae]|uniref:Uncharacterized protein n=1 Tax=Entomophthora muscae TaxID=34485 RepID=A0ACC2TAM0_9FUNG|nr:hypothetical protein DSO57_1038164 [Entomophthora muscae]